MPDVSSTTSTRADRAEKANTATAASTAFLPVIQLPKTIKLRLGLRAKNLLLEEYPLAEKEIRKSGHKWILETSVCSMLGIGRFVIGLADDIKIVDSPELVEYVNNFAAKHIPSLTKNIQHDKVK